jgi:hypothetical protein
LPLLRTQAHVCDVAARPAHIQHLLSTTIPQNKAPIRCFQRLGFTHSRTVDRCVRRCVVGLLRAWRACDTKQQALDHC